MVQVPTNLKQENEIRLNHLISRVRKCNSNSTLIEFYNDCFEDHGNYKAEVAHAAGSMRQQALDSGGDVSNLKVVWICEGGYSVSHIEDLADGVVDELEASVSAWKGDDSQEAQDEVREHLDHINQAANKHGL